MAGLLLTVAAAVWGVALGNPLQEIVYYENGNDQIEDFKLLIPLFLENVGPRAAPPTQSPIRDYLIAPRDASPAPPPAGTQTLKDGPFSDIPAHEFKIDSEDNSVKKDLSSILQPAAELFRGFNFRGSQTESGLEETGSKCDIISCYICCVLEVGEARELLNRLVRPRSRPGLIRPAPSRARSLADLIGYLTEPRF